MSQARALSKAAVSCAIFLSTLTLGGTRIAQAVDGERGTSATDGVVTGGGATATDEAGRMPIWLAAEDKGPSATLVYPAERATEGHRRGPLVMLHGMCDVPENECPWFAGPATADRAVVCPRANLACDGGGALWSGRGETRVAALEASLTRAEKAAPAGMESAEKPTLVGFSLGSFVALEVAERSPGRYRQLLLIAARVEPNAAKLRAAGIESVLLAAGDHDLTKTHLEGVARRLNKQGMRARFVSLGPVGHRFAPDMDKWLEHSLAFFDEKTAASPAEGATR
jgi:predicted esterase